MGIRNWWEIRSLRLERDEIFSEVATLDVDNPRLKTRGARLYDVRMKLATIETDQMLSKVEKLGIELPEGKSSWWWDDSDYCDPYEARSYLTPKGKRYVSKLIRDERKKNIEWWAKIVGVVLPLLTGLAGAIIGILAIWKSNTN